MNAADDQVTGQASDESLMARYQRGDRDALTTIVRRHQRALYNFAVRQTGLPAAAEDIVQEAFVRVVKSAADFKHEARFTTWIYTIVRNLCIDHLRKAALRKHRSLDERGRGNDEREGASLGERVEAPGVSVEREAVGHELAAKLEVAVARLPDDQREVFLLRETSNLPWKEIAEITGAPENTVKSRLRYALERLQRELAEYEEYARALR